ncbi:MAG TPA: hypothetical protein VF467_03350 [Afipia sp.]
MAEDNAVYPESTRSQVDDALQGFSTDELRDLLTEIEQFLSPEAKPRRPALRLAGGTYMNDAIARANTDHDLGLPKRPGVPVNTRSIPNRRSLEQEDRLVRRSEQIAFAEAKAATCRAWADRQRHLTESFVPGSADRELAEGLLANFEALARFIDGSCRRMRHTPNQ